MILDIGGCVGVGVGAGMVGAFYTSGRKRSLARCADACALHFGPAIAAWLEDPGIVEVMLNPDGRLWVDRLTEGLIDTGASGSQLPMANASSALVAHHVGAESTFGSSHAFPRSCRKPVGAIRRTASARRRSTRFRHPQACPSRSSPSTITSPPEIMSPPMRPACCARAVRKNDAMSLSRGGDVDRQDPRLVNALLRRGRPRRRDRVVLIERHGANSNGKAPKPWWRCRTKGRGVASLSDLVRSSLRLRPDRIPIGEVRGARSTRPPEGPWGTGAPGGIGTIHCRLGTPARCVAWSNSSQEAVRHRTPRASSWRRST